MKLKYEIKKAGVVTHANVVDSTVQGEVWIEASKHLFGNQDMSLTLDGVESRGLLPENAASTSEDPVMVDGVQQGTRTMYHFAKDWSVEVTDATASLNQQSVNEDSLKYLADTDWYVLRKFETNVEIPAAIVTGRAAARLAVVQ